MGVFQIAQHHMNTIHHLAKMMGWHVLAVNTHVGVGNMELIGSALTMMIASPDEHR